MSSMFQEEVREYWIIHPMSSTFSAGAATWQKIQIQNANLTVLKTI